MYSAQHIQTTATLFQTCHLGRNRRLLGLGWGARYVIFYGRCDCHDRLERPLQSVTCHHNVIIVVVLLIQNDFEPVRLVFMLLVEHRRHPTLTDNTSFAKT